MDSSPLVNEYIEVGTRFLDELRKSVPVRAAFWLRESDERNPHLYVALDRITEEKFDRAYEEVDRILGPSQGPWFSAFRVKVLGTDKPVAKAVLDLIRQYGDKRPIRLHDLTLGGRSVDELYVYPSPMPAGVQ